MPDAPDTKEPARKPAPTIPPFQQIIAEGNAEITRRARIIVERTNSTGTYPDPKQLRLLGDDGTTYVFDLLKKHVRQQVSRAANTDVVASPQDIGRADPKANGKPQIAAVKLSTPPQQTASNKPNIRARQSASTTQAQQKTSPPTKPSGRRHGRKAITTTSDWIEKQHPRRSGWWIAIRGVLLAACLVACAVLVSRWLQSLPPFNA
jgi:hypothetical protein